MGPEWLVVGVVAVLAAVIQVLRAREWSGFVVPLLPTRDPREPGIAKALTLIMAMIVMIGGLIAMVTEGGAWLIAGGMAAMVVPHIIVSLAHNATVAPPGLATSDGVAP